jgi:hypothetical protein
VLLRHGTTRKRAEHILQNGPDPRYREPGGQYPAEGFSTAPAQGPFGFGDPEVIARRKARLFPNDGGPAILEFELPNDLAKGLVASLRKPIQKGKALNWGDEIAFDTGFGIEPLLVVWSQITKRIIDLEDRSAMGTLSQTQGKALASKLQRLSKRVDIKVVDAIFDEILKQISDLKSVSCTLADDGSGLCLRSQDELVAQVESSHAKKVLRLMCARLAARSSEWAKREVSPYGDHVEFELPPNKQLFKVDFQNTPDVQRFEITLHAPSKGGPIAATHNAP